MDNSRLLGCMQVFVSVADSGSFSECARRLGISQPSVSRQVNALEEHLGVRLLQRTTRRLSLTEAGQVYCEKARQIQRDVAEANQSITGFKETASGVLKIGAPLLWVDLKITPHLSEFLQLYPEIELDIQCTDVVQDMVEERLDLVIRVGELTDSSYVAVPLAKIRMILCATPEYLARFGAPQTPGELLNHNCIIYDGHDEWEFSCAGNKQTNQMQQVHVSGNINTNMVSVILTALEQNLCIALLPDLMISDHLHEGALVDAMPAYHVGIKNLHVDGVFALYSNRKHLPAKTRAFIDFYQDKFD